MLDTSLPKDYRPSEDEEYMNSLQLLYFKQKLFQWRQDLLRESKETLDHLKKNNC